MIRYLLSLFRREPTPVPLPRDSGHWLNDRGEIVDGAAPGASSFNTSATPYCPFCGKHDTKRPFIRHAIECHRDDCLPSGTESGRGEW